MPSQHPLNHEKRLRRVFSNRVVRLVVVLTILAFALVGSMFVKPLSSIHAQSNCPAGDAAYNVVPGDTLSSIAAKNQTDWQQLAKHNNIANPNLIFVGQTICIGKGTAVSTPPKQNPTPPAPAPAPAPAPSGKVGSSNPYPYGQCTWWADERYHQLHGVYVPWTTNSNAWQWTARAKENGWKVSSTPTVGSIVVLQPWVQGAYSLGHVAVVEKVLSNGHVTASNMNWGGHGTTVVNTDFAPGNGVSFVSR